MLMLFGSRSGRGGVRGKRENYFGPGPRGVKLPTGPGRKSCTGIGRCTTVVVVVPLN